MKYEIVIGLEIHIQAKTKSKMFCRCATNYFGKAPNSHVCPVCLGLPGALPVPNKVAIDKCVALSLALGCSINKYSKFDRKNYFYPDLPKGYQISQFDLPFGYEGEVTIETSKGEKVIGITRVHMEEDTGKSSHKSNKTFLDFNKSGMPLIEMVSEPDFRTAEEVTAFAKRLKQIVRYAGISNANMERGQMRFEINMSLRPFGSKELPDYRIEVKNIGSISVLEKVIEFEYKRQAEILDAGDVPVQETRGTRDLTGATHSQRAKEEANDYRYFPEPDIPPIMYTEERIEEIRATLPELPSEKKERYMKEYDLPNELAESLVSSKAKAEWFESALTSDVNAEVANFVGKLLVGDVYALMKADKSKLADLKFSSIQLAELAQQLVEKKVNSSIAKQVLAEMYISGKSPAIIIEEKGLAVQNDTGEIRELVVNAINANPKVIEDFRKNPNAAKFLIGVVMKESKGKADPQMVGDLLDEELKKLV